MKSICFQSVGEVATRAIADPVVEAEHEAIVRVSLAGLCGSDLHPFFGRESGLDAGTVMGHEFVGHIVEVGPSVKTLKVGDRVCSPFTTNCGSCFYCLSGISSRCERGALFGWRSDDHGLHGGQAEYVKVPLADGTLVRIGDEIDDPTALLLGDNLTTGYFGAKLACDHTSAESDTFAVIGCGTVGLLAVMLLRQMGAKRVIAHDPNPARLAMAERFGAECCGDASAFASHILDRTSSRGADAVLEFVGLPEAQRLAYEVIRPGGTMSVIGCHCTPHFAFSPAESYDKNLTYRTGRCPARSLMSELLETGWLGSLDLSWCVTHRYSLDESVKAYDVFANRRDHCIKAAIDCST
ncbi:MAG: alcohol dehydrogenase catalytic domain-containing protein [Planctomycetota bacterium]